MRRADAIDDQLDARFAAGDFSRSAIDECQAALDAGQVPAELALAMACAKRDLWLHGGECALCGAPLKSGDDAKVVGALVPCRAGDRHLATTVRSYCAACFIGAQRHAEA
jgi:hypothetical protein